MDKSVKVKIWDDPKYGATMSEEDQAKVYNMMSNRNENLSVYEDTNYKMYKDFINEYKLDKYGGLRLLRRLLDRLLGIENSDDVDIHNKEIDYYIECFNKDKK